MKPEHIINCDHCYNPIQHPFSLGVGQEIKHFCCTGCLRVYEILKKNDLQEYYTFKDNRDLRPVDFKSESFAYLDGREFQAEFTHSHEGMQEFKFFIEGIHCTACIWLLEKLPEFNDGILSSKINLATNTLTVVYDGVDLSKIASLIQFLGYIPHPVLNDQQEQAFALKEDRKDLLRIGVAFACAGNIMLYSFAIYAGATGGFAKYFNFFSFLCSLPVLSYSAYPLYKSALASLRSRNLSIDIPISIALIAGFVMGVLGLINDMDVIYFDTLAILVFLLSTSRYLLKKVQQKTIQSQDLMNLFQARSARKLNEHGDFQEVLIKYLLKGDRVLVLPGELVPADGIIVKGESSVNNSLLTGESLPEIVKSGDPVFTGAENVTGNLEIIVEKTYSESRIAHILNEIKGGQEQSATSQFARKLAQNFVFASLLIGSFFFVYFLITENIIVAFERSLTLLVITCPCALGLTIPLAFIMGISSFAKEGIYIRGEATFENIINANKIFLDKTGTLTTGEFTVFSDLGKLSPKTLAVLYSLEKRSHHPIAKSLIRHLERFNISEIEITDFQEIAGVGVSGSYGNDHYQIQSSQIVAENAYGHKVDFIKNGNLIHTLDLKDEIRPKALHVIDYLKKIELKPAILTGDKLTNASWVAGLLGVPSNEVFADKKPEEKNEIVKKHAQSIMVGDGINDAMALKNAYVGIAVGGSADISLQAADVYMSKRGVEYLYHLFRGTRLVIYLIYFNILFSLLYNIVGVYLTFVGIASPLIAAILMPLSSLTVLGMTLFFFYRLKKTLSLNMI
ncbi:MAG: cadmium-translocating P-type ATPase [Halobacteriovoraceae bacterium]|nr:cadmium-translocating P-type ATPase [Halobacteriovoraceae bacterium]